MTVVPLYYGSRPGRRPLFRGQRRLERATAVHDLERARCRLIEPAPDGQSAQLFDGPGSGVLGAVGVHSLDLPRCMLARVHEGAPGKRLDGAPGRAVFFAPVVEQLEGRSAVGVERVDELSWAVAGDGQAGALLRAVVGERRDDQFGAWGEGGLCGREVAPLLCRGGEEVEDRSVVPDVVPARGDQVSRSAISQVTLSASGPSSLRAAARPSSATSRAVMSVKLRSSSAPASREAPAPTSMTADGFGADGVQHGQGEGRRGFEPADLVGVLLGVDRPSVAAARIRHRRPSVSWLRSSTPPAPVDKAAGASRSGSPCSAADALGEHLHTRPGQLASSRRGRPARAMSRGSAGPSTRGRVRWSSRCRSPSVSARGCAWLRGSAARSSRTRGRQRAAPAGSGVTGPSGRRMSCWWMVPSVSATGRLTCAGRPRGCRLFFARAISSSGSGRRRRRRRGALARSRGFRPLRRNRLTSPTAPSSS